jgi:hypothetical protein
MKTLTPLPPFSSRHEKTRHPPECNHRSSAPFPASTPLVHGTCHFCRSRRRLFDSVWSRKTEIPSFFFSTDWSTTSDGQKTYFIHTRTLHLRTTDQRTNQFNSSSATRILKVQRQLLDGALPCTRLLIKEFAVPGVCVV